jgi:hypothetical protein
MGDTTQQFVASENRSGGDRRRRRIPHLKYLLFNGRRQNVRRETDRYRLFIFDRYAPSLFAVIVAILFFSVIDAYLTLYLVENGSSELNPVMAYFLEFGPWSFLGAKYFLTCGAVLILLLFKNVMFTRPKIYAESIFGYVIIVFAMVILWEVLLIFSVSS